MTNGEALGPSRVGIGPVLAAIEAVGGRGLAVTARDVADAIWLAARVAAAEVPAPRPELPLPAPQASPVTPPRPPSAPALIPDPVPGPPQAKPRLDHDIRLSRPDVPATTEALPLEVPGGSAAPAPLAVARALRPLIARRPSRTRTLVDAAGTVRRYAREGILEPALVPERERSVSLAVVLDEGASMAPWRPTTRAVWLNLVRLPGFRRVRAWLLATDGPEPSVRPAGPGCEPAATADDFGRPADVLDLHGWNLILVLTDCVSEAWDRPGMGALLDRWGKGGRVAVVQVLPPRLWPRTALGCAAAGTLWSLGGELGRLGWNPDWDGSAGQTLSVPVPVVTLAEGDWRELARVLAGRGGARVRGVRLAAELGSEVPVLNGSAPPDLAGAADAFLAVASPEAYRLAVDLAAAPAISLPVMRLLSAIQREGSGPDHVAEVWLGGLLEPLPHQDAGEDPDRVFYDFRPSVRDALAELLPQLRAVAVLRLVTEYVERHLGHLHGLAAALHDPESSSGGTVDWDSPFGQVARHLLRRLGGPYARLAGGRRGKPTNLKEEDLDDKVVMSGGSSSELEARMVEQMVLGFGVSDPQKSPALQAVRARMLELHGRMRAWAEASLKTRTWGLSDQNATLGYIDLLFAFGLARLGEATPAQALVKSARQVLEAYKATEDRGIAASFLSKAYRYRVEQALASKPHAGQLDPALMAELDGILEQSRASRKSDNPYVMAHYAIARMREQSRILEPQEKINPYHEFMRGTDQFRKALADLPQEKNPDTLAKKIRDLYRAGWDGRASTDTRILVLIDGLALAARVGEVFTVELLNLVLETMRAAGAGNGPPQAHSSSRQGQLLERALFMAAHFDRREFVPQLVDQFVEQVKRRAENQRYELVNVVARQCLRSMRKLGLRDEIDKLLRRLQDVMLGGQTPAQLRQKYLANGDAKPSEAKLDLWVTALQSLLNLAGGWLLLGQPDRASPILDLGLATLLGETRLKSHEFTTLAQAYVAAVGQGPPENAMERIDELFTRVGPQNISNAFTTGKFYSRFHLNLVEETVLTLCHML